MIPAPAERAWLVDELAALTAAVGWQRLVGAPVLEPTPRWFPDRWTPDAAGVRRLARCGGGCGRGGTRGPTGARRLLRRPRLQGRARAEPRALPAVRGHDRQHHQAPDERLEAAEAYTRRRLER